MDEAICPLDYDAPAPLGGVVLDDDLAAWLEKLPPHQLFAVLDCCHSGSILDIERVKNFTGCYISGCKDTQTSADACIGGQRCGAMTFCLLQVCMHVWQGV